MRFLLPLFASFLLAAVPASAQEDEIVANLAGGRVIIHVARDAIIFAAIDHPLEAKSVPPRVATIGSSHIGIFFGASEWQIPAQPKPIRLDRDVQDVRSAGPVGYRPPDSGEADLEAIGISFLEKLRPLVSQLHHKFDLKPDEPLVEIVLIGYAPKDYGPEVWLIEYRAEQESIGVKSDYWQTRILRPRFTQLYPPEKHQAKSLLELRFPEELQDIPLTGLIQQNDPRLAQLRSSDPRFTKVVDQIEHGQANKSVSQDAADFLRAALPILAGKSLFIEGTMGENGGFEWLVPPEEPAEKQQRAQDKDRPPDAPTLRRKPNP
ncbi:MAG: hypothetical protein WBL63_07130 [Candidatus Acidiferrum sp.]